MGNGWCLPSFVQFAASATQDKFRYDDEEEGYMTNMASPILVTLA
jgi:hypothetical protein